MQSRPGLSAEIGYNLALLRQADSIIAQLQDLPAQRFTAHTGPHLRHVMDHYQAFLQGLPHGLIDYEARARDHRTQSDAAYAREQLSSLMQRLQRLPDELAAVDRVEPLAVVIAGGLDGSELSASQSSVLRELQFLGQHTVHHFAVIKPALRELEVTLPADFGKAPGTIRHEREHAA